MAHLRTGVVHVWTGRWSIGGLGMVQLRTGDGSSADYLLRDSMQLAAQRGSRPLMKYGFAGAEYRG